MNYSPGAMIVTWKLCTWNYDLCLQGSGGQENVNVPADWSIHLAVIPKFYGEEHMKDFLDVDIRRGWCW